MAKIIQFPSKEELNSKEQKQMLNRHLDLLEDDLRTAMSQLDELNEEIVSLTLEYSSILSKLSKLVLDE
jgi:phage terminase Nu1 subunit (DNA packaging protein)|tara:strand:+ start:372 stop:578 length:207 start_codon:yes stop_codon:yes gene_type:complete